MSAPKKVRIVSKMQTSLAIPLPDNLVSDIHKRFVDIPAGESALPVEVASVMADRETCDKWGITPLPCDGGKPEAGSRPFLSLVQRGILVPLRGDPDPNVRREAAGDSDPPRRTGAGDSPDLPTWTGHSTLSDLRKAAVARDLPTKVSGQNLTKAQLIEILEVHDAKGDITSALAYIERGASPP